MMDETMKDASSRLPDGSSAPEQNRLLFRRVEEERATPDPEDGVPPSVTLPVALWMAPSPPVPVLLGMPPPPPVLDGRRMDIGPRMGAWYFVLRTLDDYKDLKRVSRVCKALYCLIEGFQPFDRLLFRDRVDAPDRPRLTSGRQIKLHPLLDVFTFPAGQDYNEIVLYHEEDGAPVYLAQHPVCLENVTSPSFANISLTTNRGFCVSVRNPAGVTILDAMEALCMSANVRVQSIGGVYRTTDVDAMCVDSSAGSNERSDSYAWLRSWDREALAADPIYWEGFGVPELCHLANSGVTFCDHPLTAGAEIVLLNADHWAP